VQISQLSLFSQHLRASPIVLTRVEGREEPAATGGEETAATMTGGKEMAAMWCSMWTATTSTSTSRVSIYGEEDIAAVRTMTERIRVEAWAAECSRY
jgi:hypothetical protein